MAIQPRNTIKGWFLRGLKPLAQQFADWTDSYWHKNDEIPMLQIKNLNETLGGLATLAAVVGKYRDEINFDNANVNYILNAGTILSKFIIDSDTNIQLTVGDTNGGDEILSAIDITANVPEPVDDTIYAKAQRTIYFGGITGTGAKGKIIITKNSI